MKEGWEYKTLGELCNVINGLWTGKKEPFINVAVIRNTNFSKDCRLKLDDVAYIDVEVKQFATRKLEYGDIIIEKSGGSDKQPVGRAVLFDIIDGDYSFSNFTATLRIKDKAITHPKFLYQNLLWHYQMGMTKKMQSKTTGLHNLDMKAYLRLSIPVLTLAEQERIVAELDLLTEIIDKQKTQLKELDTLAQSIFYDMFGDPVENEKGWKISDFGSISNNYDFKRKPITKEERIAGIYPYYGASGIVDYVEDYLFDGNFLLISEDGANLLARSTPIAFSIAGKNWVNNHAHVIEFQEYSTQIFCEHLFNLLDIGCYVSGTAQPKLTQGALNNIRIPVPPLSLQQSFADKINAIEQQKAAITQSIAETQKLFDYTMDKYFG